MKACDLIALLQKLPPHAEVCTWDPGLSEDVVIEQVILCEGHRSPVVVLGMELRGLEGEAVWAASESRLGELLTSIRKAEQTRREQHKPVDIIDGREVA